MYTLYLSMFVKDEIIRANFETIDHLFSKYTSFSLGKWNGHSSIYNFLLCCSVFILEKEFLITANNEVQVFCCLGTEMEAVNIFANDHYISWFL